MAARLAPCPESWKRLRKCVPRKGMGLAARCCVPSVVLGSMTDVPFPWQEEARRMMRISGGYE